VLITQWFGLFPHQIHGKDLILINESDILWTPCEYTEEVTKQFTNAKLIYLGCSVNQSHLYYDYSVDFSDDVISFGGLGGNHAERTRLMTFIASQITNFSFYGYIMKGSEIDKNLKSKVRDYLGSEKLRKAISSSKIVVNSTIDGYENVKRGFNARLFEVAACRGALQIVKADSRVLEFFEEGREIIFYSDDDDLLGKINYYLNNEIERMQIVKNAYNRVKNYTYIYRATHMQYILNKELISV
jgi:spore maturation protein CgeB